MNIAGIKGLCSTILERYVAEGRIEQRWSDDFLKNFDSEKLKIGIVGKMKAGKSSLVNALVFGREVLPTGMKPLTVTLTEITYGKF